jgi:hypothetical protein
MKNIFIILWAISLSCMLFCASCGAPEEPLPEGSKSNLTVYVSDWQQDNVDFVRAVLEKKDTDGTYKLVKQGNLYDIVLNTPTCGQSTDCLNFPMVVGGEYKISITNHFEWGVFNTYSMSNTFKATLSCHKQEYLIR